MPKVWRGWTGLGRQLFGLPCRKLPTGNEDFPYNPIAHWVTLDADFEAQHSGAELVRD